MLLSYSAELEPSVVAKDLKETTLWKSWSCFCKCCYFCKSCAFYCANSSPQLKNRLPELVVVKKAAITTETLGKLNIKIEALPQKPQQILQQAAESLTSSDISQLDSIVLSLQHSKIVSENLEQEYQILKLKQKNAELQTKIDRNNKFLECLKKDLDSSRDSLASQTPNPDNIQEHIRQLKLKVASYEENYNKAMVKFNKLSVPPQVYPKSLMTLAATLATLRDEAATLRQRADDVALAREARNTFNRLRR